MLGRISRKVKLRMLNMNLHKQTSPLSYNKGEINTPDRFRFVVRCLYRDVERRIRSGWSEEQELPKQFSDAGNQLYQLRYIRVNPFGKPFSADVFKLVTDNVEKVIQYFDLFPNPFIPPATKFFSDCLISLDHETLTWDEVLKKGLNSQLADQVDYRYKVDTLKAADALSKWFEKTMEGKLSSEEESNAEGDAGFFEPYVTVGFDGRREFFRSSTGSVPWIDEESDSKEFLDNSPLHSVNFLVDTTYGISFIYDGLTYIFQESPEWLLEQLKKAEAFDSMQQVIDDYREA